MKVTNRNEDDLKSQTKLVQLENEKFSLLLLLQVFLLLSAHLSVVYFSVWRYVYSFLHIVSGFTYENGSATLLLFP
jgi:hypothetical protein